MSLSAICKRIFLLSAVLFLGTSLSNAQRTEISKVEADLVGGYLYVSGENFGRRDQLTLKLAGEPLTILVKTDVQLIAALPASTQPGTYRLVLQKGRGSDMLDSVDVTIGSSGPAGPCTTSGVLYDSFPLPRSAFHFSRPVRLSSASRYDAGA